MAKILGRLQVTFADDPAVTGHHAFMSVLRFLSGIGEEVVSGKRDALTVKLKPQAGKKKNPGWTAEGLQLLLKEINKPGKIIDWRQPSFK